MRPDSDKITIKAAQGRCPDFPNGSRIVAGRTYEVFPTPQIRRMIKEGDIVVVSQNQEKKGKDK